MPPQTRRQRHLVQAQAARRRRVVSEESQEPNSEHQSEFESEQSDGEEVAHPHRLQGPTRNQPIQIAGRNFIVIQLGGNQANRQRNRRTVSSSSSSSNESDEEEDDQQEQQEEEDLERGRSEGELSSEGSSLSDESLSSDEQESGSSISDDNESEGPWEDDEPYEDSFVTGPEYSDEDDRPHNYTWESEFEQDWDSDNSAHYPRNNNNNGGGESEGYDSEQSSEGSWSGDDEVIVLNDRQMEDDDAQQGGVDAPAQNRDANGNRNAGGRPNRHRRMIVSDESDNDDVNIIHRPKRRRVGIESADNSIHEDPAQNASEAGGGPSHSDSKSDDDGNQGCNICFEDYTNSGEHRLVSLKCGHFFGRSCIERWIRSEGARSSCPNCKTKAKMRDVRTHFAKSVRLVDNSELIGLQGKNHELQKQNKSLEVENSRMERQIRELRKKTEDASLMAVPRTTPVPNIRSIGNISLRWVQSLGLVSSNQITASARTFDFDGHYFAIGCGQPTNQLFGPSHGLRRLSATFNLDRAFVSLHTNRIRLIAFSPFDPSLILTGGEDKRVVISKFGNSKPIKAWNIPNGRQVWSGCWLSDTTVAIGVSDGRVWEYDMSSESTEPVRDLTDGLGRIPIIRVIRVTDGCVVICSMRGISCSYNQTLIPLLEHERDDFAKINSVAYEKSTEHFVVTFAPGKCNNGITHRLYRIDIHQTGANVQVSIFYSFLNISKLGMIGMFRNSFPLTINSSDFGYFLQISTLFCISSLMSPYFFPECSYSVLFN
ncbi:hypothetical protein WR25_07313 isoform C [Diploscapter pachys]|uniref:RING-type E3 ubiquitin transferase n=1 Tax=Diploscapter pachys TaxID=2018661 RepID=A0A2A2LJ51_9BILA|nr:hypothetical protein WR25_07313 isoform C [Diploscapter pachys]